MFASGLLHTALLGGQPEAWGELGSPVRLAMGGFTVFYSFASALGAMGLGTALALLPHRSGASHLWLALPPVTVGFLVVLVLGPTGVLASLLSPVLGTLLPNPVRSSTGLGIVLAAVLKETAFVTLWVRGSLDRLDARLVPTARMLGAGNLQIFREVLAPVVLPAAGVAGLIVFLYSLGAWELPFLLGPSDPQALSLFVLEAREHGTRFDRSVAAAALTVLAVLSSVVAWAVLRLERRLP